MPVSERIASINRAYARDPAFAHLREDGARFVPGEGPADALVMVIGEAPGRAEDAERRPFVGRAGSILNRFLSEYGGIRRDHCYVTNVIKFRPPGNRDPEPQEVAAAKPYLGQEIVAVEPKVIVLVGRFAYTMVFPAGSISHDHGKPQELKGRVYLPTYHPAAALYNRLLIDDLRKDFHALHLLLLDK